MKNSLLLRCFALLSGQLAAPLLASAQADAAVGTWLNAEKDGKVLIYNCGDRLCGKIVWMKQPTGPDGRPLLDVQNPDAKLRNVPVLNSVLLKNFAFAGGNGWKDGTIYDARSGRTYSSKMTLVTKNKLDLRGFIGFSFIGQTTTWTRVL